MKKKYKIILLILMIILIICLGYCLIITIKGNIIYGTEYCRGIHIASPGVPSDGVPWKCSLCGKKDVEYRYAEPPELCDRCAFITGRHAQCGSIKK